VVRTRHGSKGAGAIDVASASDGRGETHSESEPAHQGRGYAKPCSTVRYPPRSGLRHGIPRPTRAAERALVYASAVKWVVPASFVGVATFAIACGRAPSRSATKPWDPAPLPGLSIDLTPQPARDGLAVDVRVAGPRANGVRELRIAEAWAGTEGAASIDELE